MDEVQVMFGKTEEQHAEALRVAVGCFSQPQVAALYADALRDVNSGHPTFWRDVNRQILGRWKLSGLKRIKKQAWDLFNADPLGAGA